MISVLTVCGNGIGSSLMLKMLLLFVAILIKRRLQKMFLKH